jgi:hypothetical protein
MRALAILSVVWASAVAGGFAWFAGYTHRAGASGNPKETVDSRRWELILAVHPKCPCTRSSLRLLAGLQKQYGSRFSTTILVRQVEGVHWTLPEAVPGASIVLDKGGLRARELGLETSGHAVLYRPGGRLAFSGGLTSNRGSEVAGEGRSVIVALLEGGSSAVIRKPIFGCALFAASERVPSERAQ